MIIVTSIGLFLLFHLICDLTTCSVKLCSNHIYRHHRPHHTSMIYKGNFKRFLSVFGTHNLLSSTFYFRFGIRDAQRRCKKAVCMFGSSSVVGAHDGCYQYIAAAVFNSISPRSSLLRLNVAPSTVLLPYYFS